MTSSPASAAASSGACAVTPQSTVTATAAPSRLQLEQGRRVGAVALALPVGNIDDDARADALRKSAAAAPPRWRRRRRNRRRWRWSRRVDDRLLQARDARAHVLQMQRIGQEIPQRRREKALGACSRPTPRRARIRPMISGRSRRCASARPSTVVAAALAPAPAQQRTLDAEKCPMAPRRPSPHLRYGLAVEIVRRLDQAHRAALGAHHHRMGDGAAGETPHALQHGAVGHAGGGEHHLALGEIEQPVFAVRDR